MLFSKVPSVEFYQEYPGYSMIVEMYPDLGIQILIKPSGYENLYCRNIAFNHLNRLHPAFQNLNKIYRLLQDPTTFQIDFANKILRIFSFEGEKVFQDLYLDFSSYCCLNLCLKFKIAKKYKQIGNKKQRITGNQGQSLLYSPFRNPNQNGYKNNQAPPKRRLRKMEMQEEGEEINIDQYLLSDLSDIEVIPPKEQKFMILDVCKGEIPQFDCSFQFNRSFKIDKNAIIYTESDCRENQFRFDVVIPPNGSYVFAVKILRSLNDNIFVGIAEKNSPEKFNRCLNRSGIHYWGRKIIYDLNTVELFQKGMLAQVGSGFGAGDIVQTLVNYQANIIAWKVNGSLQAWAYIRRDLNRKVEYLPSLQFEDCFDAVCWINDRITDQQWNLQECPARIPVCIYDKIPVYEPEKIRYSLEFEK